MWKGGCVEGSSVWKGAGVWKGGCVEGSRCGREDV